MSKALKKKGGLTSRDNLYALLSAHTRDTILRLVKLAKSKNPNVALGANKAILAKVLPDLKSTELKGDGGGPISVTVISEYISKPGDAVTAPKTSIKGSDEVQEPSVAP